MEDPGGFRRFVEEILQKLVEEGRIPSARVGRIILSAHSGGYRPAAYILDRGGLTEHIKEVYLFDAFYGEHDKFFEWVRRGDGRLLSVYTEHLAEAHREFMAQLRKAGIPFGGSLEDGERLALVSTKVCHVCVIEGRVEGGLRGRWLDDRGGHQ
jgi:hypothetical protein